MDVIWHALLVFLAYTVTDIIWARYTIDLARHHWLALLWAVLIPIGGAVIVMEYLRDPWMLVPVGLGAIAGTAIGMWGFKKK